MPALLSSDSDPTFRLTLRWVLLAVVLLFGIGIIGGVAGQQLFAPPLPPLSSDERIISTIQEVTISPNKATAQVVDGADESVVLLGIRIGTSVQARATGVVVTSDGLVVSTAVLPEGDIVALDDRGAPVGLDRVGVDAVYGLSYWRMPNAVVAPLDLRREAVPVGSELTTISRSESTRQTKVAPFRLQELVLPQPTDAVGIQQLWRGTTISAPLMLGAPVVDDEGRLAGLLLDAEGRVVGAEVVDLSLQRLAQGQRELHPLEKMGATLQFSFVATSADGTVSFTPRITAIRPQSPAAQAQLRVGDSLRTIGEAPVAWPTNVVGQLAAPWPLHITVLRGEETVNATLQNIPSPE